MYHGAGDPRSARQALDAPAEFSPEATARVVLARVRKRLDAYTPGMPGARTPPDALAASLNDPDLERERLFLLGWLHWLNDEPAASEPFFAEAMRRAREQNAVEALAESAYWRARVRLSAGGEALAEYEGVLRTLAGSPQATAWFVDLLGRAGRVDRAEQVWKSVRGNRRVLGCPEGPLLEARMLLRRGDTTPAERLLLETMPSSGVVWVERLLLLAWIAASQKQHDKAMDLLRQAREGPYPSAALQTWEDRVGRRLRGEILEETTRRMPAALRDWAVGQQARLEGGIEQAIAAYRAALASPITQPFARYALACLGQDDPAALLASQPGYFLAVRCRARLAAERFRRREASPAEYLDALQPAAANGYRDEEAEHLRQLAAVLQQRPPDASSLRELAAGSLRDARGRNAFWTALEMAVRHLPTSDARELLLEWSKRDDFDAELRALVGRQLLRLSLVQSDGVGWVEGRDPPGSAVGLVPRPTLPIQHAGEHETSPAFHLWQAARMLDSPSTEADRCRTKLRELRSHSRWKGLAQSLLLHDAARRGDIAAAFALLDEADAWRGLPTPPRFVLRALESLAAAQPAHPNWRGSLPRWLQIWGVSTLGAAGASLAAHAGLTAINPDTAESPPGIPAVPWLLHQAARALGREDAGAALAFTRRALVLDADLAGVADARVVFDALPELERRAREQLLAAALQPAGEASPPPGGLLADAVDSLSLFDSELRTQNSEFFSLAERPDLPARLAHHLALLMSRAADARERRDETEAAEPYWQRAWLCWLRFLAAANADARRILLDHLLGQHRQRVNELLGRNVVDAARRHWSLVRDLPARAGCVEESLGRDLGERVERFREELAAEYLRTTREAMRYGVIPEGWRADYEKGLGYLRRLLSLDRDNPRLLTALVEICNDWFLDLYNQSDPAGLRTQVERFTPFALQLARRIDERPGDLSARAALADFWKFRGFVAADRRQKIDLYNEALRFNPANSNVQDLLAEIEGERPA